MQQGVCQRHVRVQGTAPAQTHFSTGCSGPRILETVAVEWAVMEGGGSRAGGTCGRKKVGAEWAGMEGVGLSLCCQRGVSEGFSAEKWHKRGRWLRASI